MPTCTSIACYPDQREHILTDEQYFAPDMYWLSVCVGEAVVYMRIVLDLELVL